MTDRTDWRRGKERESRRESACGVRLVARFTAGVFAGALVSFTLAPPVATAAPAMSFLEHRAVYELKLAESRRGPSVEAARGRLAYSFSGSACEGYTTKFRQVSEMGGSEGPATMTDLTSTSFEDAAGKTLRFKIDSREGQGPPSTVAGFAEKNGSGITVALTSPAKKTVKIAGDIVFPTEQVERIVEAAKAGKSLLELTIYDGSDNGEKLYRTLTVIGAPIPAGRAPEDADAGSGSGALKEAVRWPVTVSYYDVSAAKSGEQAPTYAMSFQLYENGVSRALKIDYNDFVLAGAMSHFEAMAGKPCTPKP